MRRRIFHAPHPPGRVNVTPMIDVIMVLIVFYLIVGQMAAESRLNMPLPMAEAGTRRIAPEPLVINIIPEGDRVRIEVELRRIEAGALAALIRARTERRPDTSVQIRAHRSLSFGAVEPVVRACRAAGVGVVHIATEPGE